MKNFIVVLIAALFSASLFDALIAQTPDVIRDQRGYLTARVKKQVYPNGTYTFFSEVNYDYGSSIPPDPLTEAKVFVRSIWEFSIPTSLPTGYYVKKVEIKYKGTSTTPFNLGYVSQYPSNPTLEQKWNLIENSLFLKTLVGSNGTYYTYEIPELLEIIRSAHEQSIPKVYLSFKTSSELLNSTFNTFNDLVLIITYDIRYKYFVKNNFDAGNLKINNENKYSGESVRLSENSINNFEALEPQNTTDYDYLWNDTEAPNTKSDWALKLESGIIKNKGQNVIAIDTSVLEKHNSIMTANLRKNLRITRIDDFSEFDNVINAGVVTHVVEQNTGQLSAPPQTINGKNYVFGGWIDNNNDFNPRNITPPDNYSYSVRYKYPRHSNQTNAYSNTSQRRFIQTPDGVKHICYESMNKVWYELSTDNGATWLLGNSGKPLSSSDSKNPSMSFYANQIGIVWQEKNGSSSNIKMALFYNEIYNASICSTIVSNDCDYTADANPVVAFGYSYSPSGNVVVAWRGLDPTDPFRNNTSLKYSYGTFTSNGANWLSQGKLLNTDDNSINPTITSNYLDASGPANFHFAYQQNVNSSTQKIYYCKLNASGNYLTNTTVEEASLNSGYSKNYTPVITLKKINSLEYIYVTWLGNRTSPTTETRALLKYKLGSNWSVTGVYGTSPVQNFSMNKGTELINGWEPTALCWSEQSTYPFTTKLMKSPGSGILIVSNLTGKDMQINNGTNFSSMFANSFSSASLPYSFSLSQNFGSINKENSMQIFNGREGIVGKNDAQFFFALGDISIDGQNIKFVSIPDSVSIGSLSLLNTYFESEPFAVSSTSNLTYGVQYGITDSLLCSTVLNTNENISFKVELIDAVTNQVLGVYDEVTYTDQNVFQYNNIGYRVNLSGIGERAVKFRLVTSTNAEFGYGLANRIADESTLAKGSYQSINYQGNLAVTDYALEQNYPNPFNPVTTIKFQMPNDGFVTLKVYDILGNEVTTLINEEKTKGRYELNFNASSLASGVYIYKIQAGSFISSKKMLLLK
jgi:Secretion system C-terminal sorting domain